MLSVLIPVYNFDVRNLIKDLQSQCQLSGIAFEILCFDDCSSIDFREINREIKKLKGVVYRELKENLGRSQIRNELADAANYDYLLFMDCDSKVIREDYIKKYLLHLDPETLLYGGRVYHNIPPAEPELYFHWLYGTNREQIPAAVRKITPYQAFMTNNFLIPGALFQTIRFDDRLTQYGHEDTIFGLELKQRGIAIHHLDNPLEHLGLEKVDRFLSKTEKGIENLYFLWQENPLIDTRLLRMAQKIINWKLTGLSIWSLRIFLKRIKRNLHSTRPNLLYFDLFKLLLLLEKDQHAK